MDRRPETRVPADIPVRVWGMDAGGKPFFQAATASSLSSEGAQLSGLSHSLKDGEIIGIQYGDKKGRFTIKWVKAGSTPKTTEAGVQILPNQSVPWIDMTAETSTARPMLPRGSEKRRFIRHRVMFPILIDFPSGSRAHMQCSATDISGRGCYIETLVPLPIGTKVIVAFWIDSDKFRTDAVVRASDPGVGMGIEFTSLETQVQEKLQEYLEKIDKGFAASAAAGAPAQ